MLRIAFRLSVVIMLAAAGRTGADPMLKCADAIAVYGRKYFQKRYKAFSKCKNREAAGLAVACGANHPIVAPLLPAAAERLRTALDRSCFDSTVAVMSADRLLGRPCEGVTRTADLVACIIDEGHGTNAEALIETSYGGTGPIADLAIRSCQATIAKAASKYAEARMRIRRNCELARDEGQVAGSCPDAGSVTALDTARERFGFSVRTRCGDTQMADDDIDFGFPCERHADTTFDRIMGTDTNAIAPLERLIRCMAAAAAGDADLSTRTAYPRPGASPFIHGVAAGDATDTSFIAWTRTVTAAALTLEVATDEAFTTVVDTQNVLPSATADNTVKAAVTGLTASTTYYYRFTLGGDVSRTGRIRTAPAPNTTAGFTFAWTGDSNAFLQPFNVLEQITVHQPDLWLYVGNTIHGDDPRSGSGMAATLADYHAKYRENRDDVSLRDLLASVGVYTIWGDHEVADDFYGADATITALVDAGNRAFRDYMPIRENGGDPEQLYRSFRWGEVAEFFLIDSRQYRSAQAYVTEPGCLSAGEPAEVPPAGPCSAAINDPSRTYLGAAQKTWLKDGLQSSTATWKFVISGPAISTLISLPYDRWEGYAADRFEVLDFIATHDIDNVVFLSTDINAAMINGIVDIPGLSVGPRVQEWVAGPIGTHPLLGEPSTSVLTSMQSLPIVFPTLQYFDLDRFNVATVALDQSEASVTYYDDTGQVLKSLTVPAS